MQLPISSYQLIMTDQRGTIIPGAVVRAETVIPGPVEVDIVTTVWLGPDKYKAIFAADGQGIQGYYSAFAFEMIERNKWLFKGVFERIFRVKMRNRTLKPVVAKHSAAHKRAQSKRP